MDNVQHTAALIVAAGRGVRAGSGILPKQYQSVAGRPILARTLDTFLAHPSVDRVLVVIGAEDESIYSSVVPQHHKLMAPAKGGETRQDSVRNGLAALAAWPPGRVLIHDAARPFVSPELVGRVADALDGAKAVVPAVPVASTLKRVDGEGRVVATVPRDSLQAAETPQGFDFDAILAAHNKAYEARQSFTDDAAVAEWAGMQVIAIPGETGNMKLTTAADIAAADRRLSVDMATTLADVRTGIGSDVHAFGPGYQVMLGGVAVPHTRGLAGHSDADVVLHALTDAILGALGDGDIGQHFPPSDPQWKDASSDRFLADAVARVAARGGMIGHLDVALVTEGPRVAPYRDAIRARIAAICGVAVDRVGFKATTAEGLGFIGRREGASAHAVATIRLPFGSAS
jgi:2-C-methyl-D-erythritol 4-phosphate cytidylyltransferase/2-C-methyl-D-erythritol 2,4-cyclodiphosphate synthase